MITKDPKTLNNRQYGYMSNATRAIKRFKEKFGKPKDGEFVINQLDESCFVVEFIQFKKIK